MATALSTAAQISNPAAKVALVDLDPQGGATDWGGRRDARTPIFPDGYSTPLAATKRALEKAGTDLPLLDCPPGFSDILIPTIPGLIDSAAVAATAGLVRQVGRPYIYVLNRADFRNWLAESAMLELGNDETPPVYSVRQSVAVPTSMAFGRTVLEDKPAAAVSPGPLGTVGRRSAKRWAHPRRCAPSGPNAAFGCRELGNAA